MKHVSRTKKDEFIILAQISHLLLVFSSSVNFLIYKISKSKVLKVLKGLWNN